MLLTVISWKMLQAELTFVLFASILLLLSYLYIFSIEGAHNLMGGAMHAYAVRRTGPVHWR